MEAVQPIAEAAGIADTDVMPFRVTSRDLDAHALFERVERATQERVEDSCMLVAQCLGMPKRENIEVRL